MLQFVLFLILVPLTSEREIPPPVGANLPIEHEVNLSTLEHSVFACQRALSACATGRCDRQEAIDRCKLDGLPTDELIILQTELRNASALFTDLPSEIGDICRQEFDTYFTMANQALRTQSPTLDYRTDFPLLKLQGAPLEALYRAELDLHMSKISLQPLQDEQERDPRFRTCPLSPYLATTFLRAQNLAFARRLQLLVKIADGWHDRVADYAVWLIFLHADLWQDAQIEALGVFQALSDQYLFPGPPTAKLRIRVEAQMPIYGPEELHAGWPESLASDAKRLILNSDLP